MGIRDVLDRLPVPVVVGDGKRYTPKKAPVLRPGQVVYENGYPLSTKTLELLDKLERRMKNNFPVALVIEGGQGKGKSTTATHIADYIEGKPININVESDDSQVAYPGSYVSKLDHAHVLGQRVLVLEEASFLSGVNAGKREVKDIVELWNTIRQYGMFLVLCLPQAHILYSPLIDQDVVRGLVRMKQRTGHEARFVWYDVHKMLKIRERQKKSFDPAGAYRGVKVTSLGVAKPLPPDAAEALDRVSMAGKTEVRRQKLIAENGYLDTSELAAQFGKSVRWVQIKIRENSIKPVMIHKNKRYYAPETIDLLEKYI